MASLTTSTSLHSPAHLNSAIKIKPNMHAVSAFNIFSNDMLLSSIHTVKSPLFSTLNPPIFTQSPSCLHFLTSNCSRKTLSVVSSKYSEAEELSDSEEEWLKKLPEKNRPLYSHSLPCIEAWLRKLGFYQSKEERAVWLIEKSDWHAQLSLDVTDLYIRYLTSGPGNLEKDMERRFSYALSREDIENAILGGP